jgi:hypothetical protein
MRHRLASLLAVFPVATVAAQTPPNLIAVTLNAPVKIHQGVHQTCTPLGICTTALPAPPPTIFYWPGGIAWDPTTNEAWATTGQQLGRFDPATCAPSCGLMPCPKSSAIAEATGLDIDDATNRLWVIDDQGVLTRCTNACPPVVTGSFPTFPSLAISGTVVTTGVTIDEINGLIFYSTADFAVGSGTIYVAQLATPGFWFQATPVFDCFSNPNLVTGIAADPGRSTLYWTNGRGTFDWTYTYNPAGPSITFTPGTCCIQLAPFPDPYTDIAIRWGGATSTGGPCANGTCPACPMTHVLRNAPLIGTTLQLGLDNAPVGVPAWCFVSIGSCMTAGPVIPPLCGQVLVPLGAPSITLGINVTTPLGPGPCAGTTTFPFAIPPIPALVGLPMSSQCLALCPPTGTAMSNCLSWVLQ